MAVENIAANGATLGAKDAFLLDSEEHFWIVERGYVDVFAVRIDAEGDSAEHRRRPFVARVEEGGGFTGVAAIASRLEPPHRLALLAVPGRDTVLQTRRRRDLAARNAFTLDSVMLIDTWVSALSEFAAHVNETDYRRLELLEADPGVPYEADAQISAHHLDVLWVSANRPLSFVGDGRLTLDAGEVLPLTERTWFSLPEPAEVTALRTPGAIQTERLWRSLDRFTEFLLVISELVWHAQVNRKMSREARHSRAKADTRDMMYRNLLEVLKGPSKLPPAGGANEPLRAAVEAVAMAQGVPRPLNFAKAPVRSTDVRHAVAQLIQPSGLRLRPIRLEPGWEREDGPSFLGFDAEDKTRPLAVTRYGGRFRAFDPSSGDSRTVGPGLAKRIAATAVKLYAPLPAGVRTGLDATLEALRGARRDIAWIVGTAALTGLLALLVPVLTGKLLGEIIPRVDWPMWVAALIALALGSLFTAVLSVVGALSMLRIETRADEALQAAVWSRLVSLPATFFRKYVAGDLADRANGVTMIRRILTGATAGGVISGVFSLFSYALLFWYNVELALWAGAIMIVLAGGTWFFSVRQIRHHREAFRAQGAIDGLVVQMIAAIDKLRQTNTEVHLLARWAELYGKQKLETLKARYWSAGLASFTPLFSTFATMAILALIFYNLIAVETPDEFTLSDFISFHSAFGQFLGGMTGVAGSMTAMVAIIPLFERVQPILEAAPEFSGTPLGEIRGRLEFQNVTFSYPASSREVLRQVTIDIQPGERVAFVGPSGAGKSTLYRLLLGFEQPTEGTVLVDGRDLATLEMGSVRRQMGVVLQHMNVISGSIYKNISSNVALTMDQAWEAARMTGLAEDIESMPMGMHTMLPEGGGGLSGGQKQRLLLARALASKPSVLLLDEPTSMLDNRSQAVIQQTLRRMNSTQVIIAHRLTTVQDVDRIYVLKDGEIVEMGSFEQLMGLGGEFARLARRQYL